MATKNNPVIGYYTCEVGHRATVHQSQRGKGRFLYTRCACGCDQRNGSEIQTKIFRRSEWLDGEPMPPPNLLGDAEWQAIAEREPEPITEPEPEPTTEATEPEPEQTTEKEPEPVTETTESEPSKHAGGGLLGGFLGVLAFVLMRG